MGTLSGLSNADLLGCLPGLVLAERAASADVVEHLIEVECRRLYLEQACSSLRTYCLHRLGYSEEAALKRARVAKLALRFPRALDELRTGAIHLTGLFLLSSYLTAENAEVLFAEARGKSRTALEELLAARFPRADVAPKVQALGGTPASHPATPQPPDAASGPSFRLCCPGTSPTERPRVEPLSAERYRYEFSAGRSFHTKLEQARELLSHAVPGGDPAALLERALDALLERELTRRQGKGKRRQRRKLREGSRHVPVEIARQVWERDGGQCTFTDAEGRRCAERRFVTFEHIQPFALGGPATLENLALLCSAHNAYTSRQVFGEAFIEEKRAARAKPPPPRHSDVFDKVRFALRDMGFRGREVERVLGELLHEHAESAFESLLRAALNALTPEPRSSRGSSSK